MKDYFNKCVFLSNGSWPVIEYTVICVSRSTHEVSCFMECTSDLSWKWLVGFRVIKQCLIDCIDFVEVFDGIVIYDCCSRSTFNLSGRCCMEVLFCFVVI